MSSSYQYIESRGKNAAFMDGMFERMVEARRQVWFGSDGSELIRSTGIGAVGLMIARRRRQSSPGVTRVTSAPS